VYKLESSASFQPRLVGNVASHALAVGKYMVVGVNAVVESAVFFLQDNNKTKAKKNKNNFSTGYVLKD
jgi:hypothetical protein